MCKNTLLSKKTERNKREIDFSLYTSPENNIN